VFAQEEQMRATNARDYIQVGAVEVNQAERIRIEPTVGEAE
jgi:hypothetical protein